MRPLVGVAAHWRELTFILKVLPMLPSGLVDRVTAAPVVEKFRYAADGRELTADLYRPPGRSRQPGIVLTLGVVPFGVDHPQVPRLCEALARAGFVALIHWSDAMRDRRLVPEDVLAIARAYEALLARDDVDPARSGLFGTCVGGSFALLAAAHPLIRDRVRFVGAFAPYSSMWTFVLDIASATRPDGDAIVPWPVDPLTRVVFERTVKTFHCDAQASVLLSSPDRARAAAALGSLPPELRASLDAMSPVIHVGDIRADCIVFGHDRDDVVIPVDESRRLAQALGGRSGVRYTEYAMFQHADPTKRHLSPPALASQLYRFYSSLHPLFIRTT